MYARQYVFGRNRYRYGYRKGIWLHEICCDELVAVPQMGAIYGEIFPRARAYDYENLEKALNVMHKPQV